MKKFVSFLRRNPKGSALVAMIAAAVIVPASLLAWGPNRDTYTIQKPATKIVFNSITNNPAHGDERNFMQVREASASNSTYADSISLTAGKEYVVYMYYHNNAASNLNLVALDTTARAEIPAIVPNGSTGTKANGYISASNADPKVVWDDISFKNTTGGDIALRYVPGSAIINSLGKVDGQKLSDNIVTSGAKLGYNALDGKIPGCNEYAGYVTFRVKADQPNFTVSKQVRKTGTTGWRESEPVNPGDSVDYLITYRNTGTTTQNNVVIKDVLPAGVSLVAGTSTLTNTSNPNGVKISDNVTSASGINIGSYGPTGTAYVKFTAKVAANDKLAACGVNTLKNIAKAETANGTKQDDAIVTTTKKCEEPKKIQVCELATKKIITIDEKNFDSSKHSKNLKDCEEEEVKEIKVCDLTSKKIVTINEKDFDAKKHSKNLSDCNTVKYVEVCRLSDKRVVTISTKEYDANKSLYSTDLNDCKETPEEPPVVPELPTTGPGEIIASIFGAGSLTAATSAYVASRRSRA